MSTCPTIAEMHEYEELSFAKSTLLPSLTALAATINVIPRTIRMSPKSPDFSQSTVQPLTSVYDYCTAISFLIVSIVLVSIVLIQCQTPHTTLTNLILRNRRGFYRSDFDDRFTWLLSSLAGFRLRRDEEFGVVAYRVAAERSGAGLPEVPCHGEG